MKLFLFSSYVARDLRRGNTAVALKRIVVTTSRIDFFLYLCIFASLFQKGRIGKNKFKRKKRKSSVKAVLAFGAPTNIQKTETNV